MSEGLGPGSIFAGCRLEGIAGRGGMGVVFRATQLALQRPVALKAIAPELAADEAYRERFQRESHLAASIDHPNVIPVYEAGERDGTLFLIMRWVEGTDLRTLLSTSGRVSPARAIRLLRPVTSALAAAHRRGLVHRDVKPANVLIALSEVETAERIAAAPKRLPEAATRPTEPTPAMAEPTSEVTEPTPAATEPISAVTEPTAPSQPATMPFRDRRRRGASPSPRRSPILWVAPIVPLALAAVLIFALTPGGGG